LLICLLPCCNNKRNERGAFSPVLPSTRGYPEGSDRLEVRVPTVGKPSKSEDSDTQGRRGAEYFSSEDFQRNCEVVKLVVVLQQYSTFTQQRVTQPLEIRDRPRHCPNYSSSSTYRTEDRIVSATAITVLDLQRQYFRSVRSTDLSRQQRPQYWSYRGSSFGSSNSSTRQYSAAPFKRPEVLLTGPFTASQYLSKQGQYPIPSPFKGPITVSKHGS
jgi:hypothetical protein